MDGTPHPGLTALGVVLILLSIPIGLSLAPVILGVIAMVVGLRRLNTAAAG